jgi:hypothetical protein
MGVGARRQLHHGHDENIVFGCSRQCKARLAGLGGAVGRGGFGSDGIEHNGEQNERKEENSVLLRLNRRG